MSDYLRNYRAGHMSGVPSTAASSALYRVAGGRPRREDEEEQRRTLGQLALRGITGVFEPIQLPKDILDAIVVGRLDPNTSIMDRLDRIEWRKYAPFGEQPQRPGTGAEFAEFVGIENDTLKKAVGFAWDIAADPLIAGGLVSGLGRTAVAVGARGLGAELMTAGRAIDRALSPAMAVRMTGRVIRSAPGGEWLARSTQTVLDNMLDSRVWWQRGPEARTFGDLFQRPSVALSRQMPREVPGDVSQSMGRRFFLAERVGQQHGRDVELRIMSLLQEAHTTAMGRDSVPLMRRFTYDLGRAVRRMDDVELASLNVTLRDTVLREAFNYADNVGYGFSNRTLRQGAPQELMDVVGTAPQTGAIASYQRDLKRHAQNTIRTVAVQTKFKHPDEAVRRFNVLVQRIQEADALTGYYASGHPFIQQRWVSTMMEQGYTPREALDWWSEIRRRTMAGETLETISDFSIVDGDGNRVLKPISELLPNLQAQIPGGAPTRGVETVGDIISPLSKVSVTEDVLDNTGKVIGSRTREIDGFFGLDLGAYFYNLKHGHLRRVYGVFNHPDDFQGFMKQMEAGKVIPGNILYSRNVQQIVGQVNQKAADVLDNYIRTLESTGIGPVMNARQQAALVAAGRISEGQTTMPRGLLVRQEDLARVLRENEFSNGEIRESLNALITGLQGTNDWKGAINNAHNLIAKYERTRGLTQAAGSGGTTVWGTRNRQLEREMLTALGEEANPFPSLIAQARDVRLRLPQAELFTQVYQDALKSGYLIEDATRIHYDPDTGTRFVTMPDDPAIWGGFAGKNVHPFLRKELERVLRARTENRGNALSRLRSLITGGYLASPNVIAANIFGGVFTTALAGENPAVFVPELMRNFNEFRRASTNPNYTFQALEDLKHYIDVDSSNLVTHAVRKGMDSLRGLANAADPDDLRRISRGVTQWVQNQLDAPLGQKWAGLDGFQFTENWMKVSAFTARRKTLAIMEGVDLAEFLKPRDQRSLAALRVDAQAAEFARTSVFDYSDLPGLLDNLRNTGLMLFPGFQYFIIGRTFDAAMNNPGALAMADRLSGAVADLVLDEDERLALYASLPSWLMEDHGIPVPFMSYTSETGERRHTVIPLNQLLPTNPFTGTPLVESLATGGIYRPLFEAMYANIEGSGEAPFSQQFGQRVFSAGAPAGERAAQTMWYVFTNLMPGLLRKVGGSYHPDYGLQGGILSEQFAESLAKSVGPRLFQSGVPIAPGMQDWLFSWREIQTRRADRRLGDYMISTFLRSPQVITVGGGLTSSARRVIESARVEKTAEVGRLRRLANIAFRAGNPESARRYYQRIVETERIWAEDILARWQAVMGGTQ